MGKDKEWLKKEIESDGGQLEYLYANYYTDDKAIMIDDVRHLINQLDEPEQVVCAENEHTTPTVSKKEIVIPQYVADFIEEAKENDWTIRGVFYQIIKGGIVNLDADEWIEKNPDAFAQVWTTGECTIEQPKLLTVTVKDCDKTIATKQVPEYEANKMMREW